MQLRTEIAAAGSSYLSWMQSRNHSDQKERIRFLAKCVLDFVDVRRVARIDPVSVILHVVKEFFKFKCCGPMMNVVR